MKMKNHTHKKHARLSPDLFQAYNRERVFDSSGLYAEGPLKACQAAMSWTKMPKKNLPRAFFLLFFKILNAREKTTDEKFDPVWLPPRLSSSLLLSSF